MNEGQKIEELTQQLDALCDVRREAEANKPKYEAQIARFENEIADALVDQMLNEGEPKILDELMAEQARYQEALRKARLVPEACERWIKAVNGEISKLERLFRRKERYQDLKEDIEDLVSAGDFERAVYQAADLQEFARECGMERDASEFLERLNQTEEGEV